MKNLLLAGFFFMMAQASIAQKQNNVWCFGIRCGMDFKNGAPVSFSGAATHQLEGSASIADSNGNLLFYTDGDTVWNKNNVVMPNGTGLYGNTSSAQAALIVNSPSNKNQYYVFTTEGFDGLYGGHGFNYSIVDMTLQGGLGDVMAGKKDKHLLDHCDERIAATPFANGQGLWVVTTSQSGAEIDAFRLTTSGVDTIPIVSTIPIVNGYFSACMKFSPDGSKLAQALHTQEFDIMDFDRATGMISNPVIINDAQFVDAYGVEFSPNGKYLYGNTGGHGKLFQFDLTASNIEASAVKIYSSQGFLGGMQLAPDGKIYIAYANAPTVGVIRNPNGAGINCDFYDTGFALTSGMCQYGLPNMFVFEPVFSGIKDIGNYSGTFIYPNPANNTFTFKTTVALQNERYILFDVTGRTVKEGILNGLSTTIQVDGLAAGIYVLQAGNKKKQVFKVVKE